MLTKWRTARAKPSEFGLTPSEILAARHVVQEQVRIAPQIMECLADIAAETRHDRRIDLGVSTRSLVLALPALQVWAMLNGRDYVSPHDVKALAIPIFSHRIEPAPGVTDIDAVVTYCTAGVVERYAIKRLAK